MEPKTERIMRLQDIQFRLSRPEMMTKHWYQADVDYLLAALEAAEARAAAAEARAGEILETLRELVSLHDDPTNVPSVVWNRILIKALDAIQQAKAALESIP